MADDNKNKKSRDDQIIEFLSELIALVGKFMFDLTVLMARGSWRLVRAIRGNRTESASAESAAQQNESAPVAGGFAALMSRLRGQGTAESEPVADASTGDKPATNVLERTPQSDPEALAMLQDLLNQENAKPTDDAVVADAPPQPATDDTAQPQTAADPEAVPRPQAEADEPPTPTDTATETPKEDQARIAAELEARQRRLAEEQTLRTDVYDEEEERQQRLRAAVEADRERIRQEREAREARFRAAEAERRRRQAEAEAPPPPARLQDAEPAPPNEAVADDDDSQNIQGG